MVPAPRSAIRRRMPRAEREQRMLDAAGRGVRARRVPRRVDGRDRAGRRDLQADALQLLRLQGGAVRRVRPALRQDTASGDARRGRPRRTGRAAPASRRARVLDLRARSTAPAGPCCTTRRRRSGGRSPRRSPICASRSPACSAACSEGEMRFAHAFVGAGESLAGWWLSHPERTKDEVATLLLDIASLGLGEATASARALR